MTRVTVDPRARAMSEAQLQDAIIDFAEMNGWKVTFAPDWMKRLAVMSMQRQRRGDRRWPKAGLPDLIMCRKEPDGHFARLVVAELKSHSGALKPEQVAWLDTLRAVPWIEVFVWKPESWLDGTIEQVLA